MGEGVGAVSLLSLRAEIPVQTEGLSPCSLIKIITEVPQPHHSWFITRHCLEVSQICIILLLDDHSSVQHRTGDISH